MAGEDVIGGILNGPGAWHHALGVVSASGLGLLLCLAYLVGDWRRCR